MARVRYSPGSRIRRQADLRTRIDALNERAWARKATALPAALALLRESHRLAVITGHDAGAALSLTYQAGIHADRGRYREALECDRRALLKYRRLGDKKAMLSSLMGLGWYCEVLGRPARAAEYFRRGLALAAGMEGEKWRIIPLRNLAVALREMGRLEEAAALLSEGLAIAGRCGEPHHRAMLGMSAGLLAADRGQPGHAQSLLAAALAEYRAGGDASGEAYALANLADLAAKGENPSAALPALREARTLARRVGDLRLPLHLATTEALALSRLGRGADSRRRLVTALAAMDKMGERHGQAPAWRLLGDLWRDAKRPVQARRAYARGAALADELGHRGLRAEFAARIAALPAAGR